MTSLRWIHQLSRASGTAAAIMLAAATSLILADMVSRNLAGRSIAGVTELSSWFMACLGWLALSYTLRADGHIQVGIVIDRLPQKTRRAVAVVVSGSALIFLVFTTIAMVERFEYFLTTESTGVETGFPIWWVYSIVLVGAGLFTLQFVARFVDDCHRLRRLS